MSKKIYSVIKISRPINFLITFITVIAAGIIVTPAQLSLTKLSLAALAASLSAGAGNIINDIYDIEIDRINRPERPLPSGILLLKEAWLAYLLINISAIIIAGFINLVSFIIVIVSQSIIFLYSYRLKNSILIGNIAVAFLTGLTLFFGATAVEGDVTRAEIPAVFAFLINFVREIVKDIEDIEGDQKNGVITFPTRYGINKAKILIAILTVSLIFSTTIPFLFRIYKIEYFLIVMTMVNVPLVRFLHQLFSCNDKADIARFSGILKVCMVAGLVAVYLGGS